MKRVSLPVVALLAGAVVTASAQRTTLSLDGQWQLGLSVETTALPAEYPHRVPVPGLANLAKPALPNVDQFDSMEVIANRIRKHTLPESARVQTPGVAHQAQNYYWYRREFKAPATKAVGFLKVNKAQFGTAVWLNGRKMGEYAGCFTASYFDLSGGLHWNDNNVLVIRIGAHPGVLPVTYPAGSDFEKLKWTPGIYDSVSVCFCDNPVVETVQVAPKVAGPEILVQTRIKNYGPACSATVAHKLSTWKGAKLVTKGAPETVRLEAGQERTLTQTIQVPGAQLWSPEDPFLYVLETSTGGDTLNTRFGLREFHSDAATRRFFLNGKPYYLRGSNITLHRFFEDPECGDLPWSDNWVRRLLSELPKKMHWNSFRFCIGPAPERWFELADETGLLIQNEFFVWTGAPGWDRNYARHWDVDEMLRQYRDWVRDGWNHPSVAIFDANNESEDPIFGEKIIPEVRKLDLSERPWENSYNAPEDPNDPVEYHPYLYQPSSMGPDLKFHLSDLEKMDGVPTGGNLPKEPHPVLLNEYGWLWLNRDGSPTLLTQDLYPKILGPNSTAEQRFAFDAYALAGKTEFWRARRHCAGILHFVYLTCSYPGVYTSDHFVDVRKLKLEPHFADYISEAFKPLGVYINFFQPSLKAGEQRDFTVTLVNDLAEPTKGELVLSLLQDRKGGGELARAAQRFELTGLGNVTCQVPLKVPGGAGKCILKATAKPAGKNSQEPTVSRRWVNLE
jgi:beta-galactosidase